MRPAERSGVPAPLLAPAPAGAFFVVGCPRSGTTLLRFMLDAHPRIAVMPETHYVQACLRAPARARVAVEGRAASPARSALDAFVRSPAMARMALDETRLRAAVGADARDPWAPLRAAMRLYAERRGASLVGEKTPSHALHGRALAAAFPDARFLCVSRDPRAVVSSWRRTSWGARPPVEIAERWRRHAMALRDLRRAHPTRCLALRYEDLVRDPASGLRTICGFLGVAFDRGMLDFHLLRDAPIDAEAAPDEGLDNPLTFAPADPRRIDAWRAECPPDVARVVESICARSMASAGYLPATPVAARLARGLSLWPGLWRARARRRLRRLGRPPLRAGAGTADQPSTP